MDPGRLAWNSQFMEAAARVCSRVSCALPGWGTGSRQGLLLKSLRESPKSLIRQGVQLSPVPATGCTLPALLGTDNTDGQAGRVPLL